MKTHALITIILGVVLSTLVPRAAHAQAAAPPPSGPPPLAYGQGVAVETARKVATNALAEGKKNGWTLAVAVVDTAGDLVFFERMDNTQSGSVIVAQEKARTAARFKRPTKAFEEALANGRHAILGLPGVTPVEGGIPIVVDGKIVGAVGVSGATSQQDSQCAQAGVASLGKAEAPPPGPPRKK